MIEICFNSLCFKIIKITQNVEDFCSLTVAEFLEVQAEQILQELIYKTEHEEKCEWAVTLTALQRLREESEVIELKDEDNLLNLTVRVITIYYNNHILIIVQAKDSEFSAENNEYQKITSRRLTVTVKCFKCEI